MAQGLIFSQELTDWMRINAKYDNDNKMGDNARAETLLGLLVFINPTVASLPKHRHLFGSNNNNIILLIIIITFYYYYIII